MIRMKKEVRAKIYNEAVDDVIQVLVRNMGGVMGSYLMKEIERLKDSRGIINTVKLSKRKVGAASPEKVSGRKSTRRA